MNDTTSRTIQDIAREARSYYILDTRNNGFKFWAAPDCPKWIHDMNMHAHEEMMPDDYRYEFIVDALEALMEFADEDYPEEYLREEYRDHALIEWLGSHAARPGYVDESGTEIGYSDIMASILAGYHREQIEVLDLVRGYLEDMIDGEPD